MIEDYDGRARIEPCIGEAQRAGLLAIPSKRFCVNQLFFQIVMMAYNLWRWMNHVLIAKEHSTQENKTIEPAGLCLIPTLRLKMLFLAAKIVTHGGQEKIRYSVHDARSAELIDFMKYLDKQKIRFREYKKTG